MVFVISTLAFCLIARSQDPVVIEAAPKPVDIARQEIQARYDEMQQAISALDVPVLLTIWSDRYHTIDGSGEVTDRRELEAAYKAQAKLGLRDPGRRSSKIMKIWLSKPGQARLRVFHAVAFDIPKMPLGPAEEKVRWEEHQDFWAQVDGRWRLNKSEILRSWSEVRRKDARKKDPNRDQDGKGGGDGGSGGGGGG